VDDLPDLVDVGSPPERPVVSGAVTVAIAEQDPHTAPEHLDRDVRGLGRRMAPCYDETLEQYPEAAGRIELYVTVGLDGHVDSVSVGMNSTGIESLATCVVQKTRRVRFSRSRAGDEIPGDTTEVVLDYRFSTR